MNKTVAELGKECDVAVEIVNQTVTKTLNANGWTEIYPYQFKAKEIVITKIHPVNKNYIISFYDDNSDYVIDGVIVPPDFMFKMLDNDRAKDIIKKYELNKLLDLNRTCYYGENHIGSDPEIFIENSKGVVIPAFHFLGSKDKPNKTPGYDHGYHTVNPEEEYGHGNDLYWDGFQAEFTTSASHCMGWHGDSLQAGLKGLYKLAKKFNKNARLSIKTVMDIPLKALKDAPPECVAFGCNPSLNAYGMKGLEAPGIAINYRSAGGHVHLGIGKRTPEEYVKIVKAMDAILGVAGVSMCAKYDDPRRRIMYGLAGEYRTPPHGLEYRVLSNAWLFHPVIANIVFDLARTACMFGLKDLLKHWQATEQETIDCINTCDAVKAREILTRNKDLLLKLLNVKLGNMDCSKYAYKAIIEGMESIIADPSDIVGNWGLKKKWKTHCDGKNKNINYTLGHDGDGKDKKI